MYDIYQFNYQYIANNPVIPNPTQPSCPCVLGQNYFIEGVPASASGDPHFTTFERKRHDFQGQPSDGGKELFYYMYPCWGYDQIDMPIYMLGRHVKYGSQHVSGLDYLTLRLFDNDEYLLYLAPTIYEYVLKTSAQQSVLYDTTKSNGVTTTSITDDGIPNTIGGSGGRFEISVNSSEPRGKARIDVEITWDTTCELIFSIESTHNFNDPPNRYQMSQLIVEPSQCLKCFTCGLLGDFTGRATRRRLNEGGESDSGVLKSCDGNDYTFTTGINKAAHDGNGWGCEYGYVEDNVEGEEEISIYIPDEPEVIPPNPCDVNIEQQVKNECQRARNAKSECCSKMEFTSLCNYLQDNCGLDACVAANGTVANINSTVAEFFTNAVDAICDVGSDKFDTTKLEPAEGAETYSPTPSPTPAPTECTNC